MRTLFTINLLFISFSLVLAQQPIDQYLETGMSNNLVLQQKSVGLEKAMNALKISKGMFMPSINLLGSYTTGDGGRDISFPVGDMLNPVYSTLNQLTDSNQFPQIENVNENFFPKNFYDAKIRTSVPILNSDLIYNQKIRQQQVVLEEYEVAIYKRELIKNIKTAYYSYLSANEAISIYKSALERAQEGIRVNESLLANGKGLPAYLLRAQSEVENINAQIVSSERQAHNAQLYFNFLLNREADAEIVKPNDSELSQVTSLINDDTETSHREETKQLSQLVELNHTILKMNQSFWSPRLSGFVDLGSQYQNWKFNNQSRYYLVGVQVDVPLFAGFTNRNRINQLRLDIENSRLNQSLVSNQLAMSASIAKNNLIASYQDYLSAKKQLEAAQSYQRLIEKGYKEGVNSFIETVDARSQLTSAQLQVTINHYRVLIAEANYERETASYSFN